jgi:L-fucose mutarotase/ribose pyranase (RbsD/FucU family)
MLKNIPAIISPELLYHMMCMGHGDELVLADGDFPVETFSRRVVYAYGHEIPVLLRAILPFFPLDPFVEKPVAQTGQSTVPLLQDMKANLKSLSMLNGSISTNGQRIPFWSLPPQSLTGISSLKKVW